jgi:hypothetical protein
LLGALIALATPTVAHAYDWPVRPFDREHPIRGTFGDPRTRTGRVDRDPTNPQSFHDGVDIEAHDGTPVYSIAAGRAFLVRHSGVAVASPEWSTVTPLLFGYWHVDPVVADHQLVARHQLLGYVHSGAGHVHLSEQRLGRYVDPLRRGGLSPYSDTTVPVTRAVRLRRCSPADLVLPESVSGCVDIVVDAFDPPPLPLHSPWGGTVLPPARIVWGGLFDGPWLPACVHQDVYVSRFSDVALSDVYAPGTLQNRPDRPGHYYFWLAHHLDTHLLEDGTHMIWVSVYDARGNVSTTTFEFTVANDAVGPAP